jgi:hypothetical protein
MTAVSTSTIKYSDISASYVKPNILGQTLHAVLRYLAEGKKCCTVGNFLRLCHHRKAEFAAALKRKARVKEKKKDRGGGITYCYSRSSARS